MIKDLFPVKIIQKDLEISDEINEKISNTISAIHATVKASSNFENACEEMFLFNEENLKNCPELSIILDSFVQGFSDLLDANGGDPIYQNHEQIKGKIRSTIIGDKRPWTKLPFMRARSNEFKASHTHEQSCVWGILYLQDIDHDLVGGQLYLEDPHRSTQKHFKSDPIVKIEAKKNRLLIVPNYVWHGVTPYSGEEDRLSIVVSLPNSILE
jgi:hypothetical protein